jgi:hypothetical protein
MQSASVTLALRQKYTRMPKDAVKRGGQLVTHTVNIFVTNISITFHVPEAI